MGKNYFEKTDITPNVFPTSDKNRAYFSPPIHLCLFSHNQKFLDPEPPVLIYIPRTIYLILKHSNVRKTRYVSP